MCKYFTSVPEMHKSVSTVDKIINCKALWNGYKSCYILKHLGVDAQICFLWHLARMAGDVSPALISSLTEIDLLQQQARARRPSQ